MGIKRKIQDLSIEEIDDLQAVLDRERKRKWEEERKERFLALQAKQEEEQKRFVGVTFASSLPAGGLRRSEVYTYEVKPGTPIQIGDYLRVFSALTYRDELVRVVRLGKGDWAGRCKLASRIEWVVVD